MTTSADIQELFAFLLCFLQVNVSSWSEEQCFVYLNMILPTSCQMDLNVEFLLCVCVCVLSFSFS